MLEKLSPGCLHTQGRVIKKLEVAEFILTESVYAAESRLPKHSHENSYFCFVLQGNYTEFYEKRELYCNASTLTFRPSGAIHEDRFHNQDGRIFVIEVSSKWLERLHENSLYLSDMADYRNGYLLQLFARLNQEFHKTDNAALLAIEGLAIEISAEAARYSSQITERTIPPWLSRAQELLREHFSGNLRLDKIAAEVGVHPVHLASVFRRKFHCTIGEFVRHLRIEHACRAIAKNENTLADIALNAGFADQSHFSRTFKRQTGLTPGEYKKLARRA